MSRNEKLQEIKWAKYSQKKKKIENMYDKMGI